MPAPSGKLISKANAAAMRFLNTELETGLSFVRMAGRIRGRKKPRPGDAAKIKRYLDYARAAYDVVSSHIGNARADREELRQIKLKFSELRNLLEPNQP